MTIKICTHPDGCQNEPRRCLAEGCQRLPKREELTPEEKDAERYLLKRYGPELEAVPMHWVKSVAEYAAEKVGAKWIPVTEQMPPELTVVNVFIPAQDNYTGSAIWERSEGWYESYESVLITDEVTHWMPILSPPNMQPEYGNP